MFFKVIPHSLHQSTKEQDKAVLVIDNWDDFGFKTTYYLYYYDSQGVCHEIGMVKIGQFDLKSGRPPIPDKFDSLDETFFSLGQDDSFYENMNSSNIGEDIRLNILEGLRDVALDDALYQRAENEKVMEVSLLRSVSRSLVQGQYRRLATGGARLKSYDFNYIPPKSGEYGDDSIVFSFKVVPESNPPTNIHVLIGRNGVGKTRNLQLMVQALFDPDAAENNFGRIQYEDLQFDDSDVSVFDNIVSVTFSAFDPFLPMRTQQVKSEGVRYHYVGLMRILEATGEPTSPKTHAFLGDEFGESAKNIQRFPPKHERWKRALSFLESDPLFQEANISALANRGNEAELKTKLVDEFARMSAGHKIVLLTVTKLVETVEEKTVVLIDEPEAHLHPPLLSAFVRALSDLLTNRNGVALIATHSPVVLQEVPSTCVSIIRRTGDKISIERPAIETFGENVGVLTREVFRLEVTHSGFHRLIAQAVNAGLSYDAIIDQFNGQLGAESRAIIQGMIASRDGSGGD